nr:hypothetical protein LSAT_9X27720 [Ipomoea trifida]
MNDQYTRDVHTIALQGNNGANEHTWSANKELLEFDFAMTTMEVDSEQTFGKTTHENAKTPTMQGEDACRLGEDASRLKTNRICSLLVDWIVMTSVCILAVSTGSFLAVYSFMTIIKVIAYTFKTTSIGELSAMAAVNFLKVLAVFVAVMVAVSAVSAQEAAPAPSPASGASSLPVIGAVLVSSMLLSLATLIKH